MFDKLNSLKNKSIFPKYEKSVNELYNMFCEMIEKKVEDISVFDKAAEIDECYGDIETKAPSKYVGIRRMIIKNYKDFNIEYRKSKQPKNTFSEEFVRDELMKGDCKLISRYLCSTEKIYYEYNESR